MRRELHMLIRFNTRCLLTFCIGLIALVDSLAIPVTLTNDSDALLVKHHSKWQATTNFNWRPTLKDTSEFKGFGQLNEFERTQKYWLLLEFEDKSDLDINWVIELYDFTVDEVELLYYTETGEPKLTTAGDQLQFQDKAVQHKNQVLRLPKGRSIVFLGMINKDPRSNNIWIKSNNSLLKYALTEYYALGIFYGLLVAIALVNAFLFFNTRDSTYFYYILFALGNVFYFSSMDGLGFQYLWPRHPGFNETAQFVGIFIVIVTLLLYCISFLDLHKSRKMYVIWQLLFLSKIIWFVTALSLGAPYIHWRYLDVIYIVFVFVLAFLQYKKGLHAAIYMIYGFGTLLLGYVINVLWSNHLIGSNIFAVYSSNVATVVEMLFFSFAISVKIKEIMVEKTEAQEHIIVQLEINDSLKDKVNRELEDKVLERTEEIEEKNRALKQASEELASKAEEITQMNMKLDLYSRGLEKNILQVQRARVSDKRMSYEDFIQIYPMEKSCHAKLVAIKWGAGFNCPKCDHDQYKDTDQTTQRRCTKCNYIDSTQKGTLYEGVRFDLRQAFFITYTLVHENEKVTTKDIATEIELRQATAGAFRKKVETKLKELIDAGKPIGTWEDIIL